MPTWIRVLIGIVIFGAFLATVASIYQWTQRPSQQAVCERNGGVVIFTLRGDFMCAYPPPEST